MRAAGIRHSAPSRSNSVHSACLQFARAHEHERRQLQRQRSHRMPAVSVDRPHELADPDRIGDRGKVLGLDRRQGIPQVSRNVVLCAAGRDRVPKHAARQGSNAVRGFMATPGLDPTQRGEQFLGCDRSHRATAQIGVKAAVQACSQDGDGLRAPATCSAARAIPGPRPRTSRASPRAWPCAPRWDRSHLRRRRARLVALLARALQRDIRIGAEGDQFLEVPDSIAQAPQAAAGRRDQEE